ncbi:DUF3833 family protein [Sphingomonas tabacisoli]|uniref:DUF3833 family protein n=1 Tax=Sphingomonas tabacisoli TaxID=2249466 RepID=A0ABW4I2K8_9SPHN
MSRSASAKFALLALALVGCSAAQRGAEMARPEPFFDVVAFFNGRTMGDGRVKILFSSAERLRVDGQGHRDPDGTLVLDQQVRRGDRKIQSRQWRMRPIGGGRIAGTLSDASGPVSGDVRGNVLHLSYPMKDGTKVEQWIYLQTGGQLAVNRMNISKFGLTVATIDEAIRKLD